MVRAAPGRGPRGLDPAVLIPAVTAAHWFNEIRFCKQWMARLERAETKPRMIWDLDTAFKANWAN